MSERNELGATTMEIEKSDGLFELRGLDSASNVVAQVRLRIGDEAAIPDLTKYVPGVAVGSELTFSARGIDERMLSAETRTWRLSLIESDAAMSRFLTLPSVATALKRDANVTVMVPVAPADRPYYGTYACSGSQLRDDVTVDQCCWTYTTYVIWGGEEYTYIDMAYTMARNYAMGTIARRDWDLPGTGNGCVAQDGYGSCAGDNCYYGPGGFARALTNVVNRDAVRVRSTYIGYSAYACAYDQNGGGYEFGYVAGTMTQHSCPGGDAGGEWSY